MKYIKQPILQEEKHVICVYFPVLDFHASASDTAQAHFRLYGSKK